MLLVESVYEALKPHKVTKAAIEAKIREIGEKDKVKKKWVVKPAFLTISVGTSGYSLSLAHTDPFMECFQVPAS